MTVIIHMSKVVGKRFERDCEKGERFETDMIKEVQTFDQPNDLMRIM